ncbi:DoxX family protein [Mycolicibacterium sp. J2]|uniref:DoxX family protein n=1 Tax=Mycolicibacterium sp. J2 TaxID=2993511 RepID=UPI00224A8C3F|nr:DoxX family protein [Mycolicibacterium sp. J2]MCX2711087.1 DoxX family protein [Mycolicibacterium sp. J2]
MLLRRVARPLLSVAFIGQGVETLLDTKSASDVVRPTLEGLQTLPDPVGTKVPSDAVTVARVNAGVQIGAGLLLATGRIPRVASALLAATVIPGNLGDHMFWNESDPERKAAKRRGFLTDLSLIGGLLLASADTAGKPSLGWRGRRAARLAAGAVTAALPLGDSGPDVEIGDIADKIGHGLQVGAERGRDLAATAIERGAPIAEKARRRGTELAETAIERGAPIAEKARRRGAELAETALEQGSDQLSTGWHRLRQQI